jgi:hypothetical protein
LPTDTNYFEPFDVSDRYILLDQPNQTPIGDMIAVFDTDPRVSQYHYASKLPFRPNEREISVTWAGTGPTVWILIRTPPLQFSFFGENAALHQLVEQKVAVEPRLEANKAIERNLRLNRISADHR